ncbi:DEAD/DEAH box helicase [Methanoplanus limicola]|uniref:DEAD/DEAH box helicase domain protein n=1 Tax=Methanoplanus limicola DSM 2279 TaxID=937775 RepID=H1Z1M6_9EURY|nr:DEAD/DEAH box helicase [Methanoplanus limicola]EHQ34552.1 DEAD/DEAH box helicase domain protein [Methanoplanus limicola DSM 2279]
MTINPVLFASEIKKQHFRYQTTAFPLSDPELYQQVKEMLSGNNSEGSELLKGPYVSISRPFAEGELLSELVSQKKLHPGVAHIAEHPRMFSHQQETYDAITSGKHCLVSTGTGSGKTESFLYPILDHCFRLKDENAPPGITAVIVYPMNALAIDQLERLRGLLAGTGITFGMYIGSTKRRRSDIVNTERMQNGEGRADFEKYRIKNKNNPNITIIPFEEKASVEEIREEPPRILLTNINQLEYILTRPQDLAIIEDSLLKYIVFDETHTYTGSRGAEVALLIRRLRAFANKSADDVLCIGTSATIIDPDAGTKPGAKFFNRFFGVNPDNIEFIQEKYIESDYPEKLMKTRSIGNGAPELFRQTLEAINDISAPKKVSGILRKLGLEEISDESNWKEELYDILLKSDMLHAIETSLTSSKHLWNATHDIWEMLKRPLPKSEEESAEVLIYLTLGATAEKDNHPLIRPQIHFFIRGLAGVVGTLRESKDGETPANIYFSHQKAEEANPDPNLLPTGIFPVVSCQKCGQHFFEINIEDISEDDDGLLGGIQEGDNIFWPPATETEGAKVTFTNRFVSESESESEDVGNSLKNKRELAYICRFCGAIHKKESKECLNCHIQHPVVSIFVIKKHGFIKKCPVCRYGAPGKNRSSLRPLSAVQVADIHILTQSMINAESADNRKLILFADNRQDAAFQAAWMTDHARRYRLRHLIFELISNSLKPLSIGDLVEQLTKIFEENKELGKALATEVYARNVEEGYSSRIKDDMKKYLRITILREIATSFSQRDNLETWGKLKISYFGLENYPESVKDFAEAYNLKEEETINLIGSVCDYLRRSKILWDPQEPIFSHYWSQGMADVQRKFLPYIDLPPKGVKLERETDDRKGSVMGLTSSRGRTTLMDFVKRIGVDDELSNQVIEDIWKLLTEDLKILVPVSLKDGRGNQLPGSTGVYQIDSATIGLSSQNERYRCTNCNRIHTRNTPGNKCMKIYCKGNLVRENPPEEDYNVSLLNQDFMMVIPREHTAQVPADERHTYETSFKDPKGSVNCLVATPTLELGIDVGDLDMVLMRNVPPLPSNYWQRAGRAGRRHRMAVIFTYCLKKPHDDYFFEDPMRLLGGTIYPPQINLKNPVMIEKHIHSAIISEMILAGEHSDSETAAKIKIILNECLPPYIKGYLFENGNLIRKIPPDLKHLEELTDKFHEKILNRMKKVFLDYWPDEFKDDVSDESLEEYLNLFVQSLKENVSIIHKRLLWAKQTRDKLTEKERDVSQLDEMEQKLLSRCRDYIRSLEEKKLENYTLNVLANGGFLPGYAIHQGSVNAFASDTYTYSWNRSQFELSRPESLAIREFVPGNMIYANGGKYRTVWYHLPFSDKRIEPDKYIVDTNTFRVLLEGEISDGYAADEEIGIPGIAICDTELGFISLVSDEEQNRFKMPVSMGGIIQKNHNGIDNYNVKEQDFSHHHSQHLRLINIGPADKVAEGQLGYPICLVCGASRSPYASEAEIKNFIEMHKKSCGHEPEYFCITADTKVDGLLFKDLESFSDAVNLAEGLKAGANISLEMDTNDLDYIIIMQNEDQAEVFLYDPMPGGSGILDQVLEQWNKIIKHGVNALRNCPNNCESSCYECLKSYGNMHHHKYLDRYRAIELLEDINGPISKFGTIPPAIEDEATPNEGDNTNTAEMRFSQILEEYNFPTFVSQKEIDIPELNLKTIPDFYYEDLEGDVKIAIYLDGLSREIHGNSENYRRDEFIRTVLRSKKYSVVEVSASALDDPAILKYKLLEISMPLNNK